MTIDRNQSSQNPVPGRETNIFLGLGSNLGDRETNLHLALGLIALPGLRVVQVSSIFETEPVGFVGQPWFLNQVIELEPDRTLVLEAREPIGTKPNGDTFSPSPNNAAALLRALLRIETELGRERSIPDGPRVVDIDLLLFGESVLNGETTPAAGDDASRIVVPHPRMHLRRFVLEPLCEIAPELVHPVLKKSYQQLLAELEDRSVVRLFS